MQIIQEDLENIVLNLVKGNLFNQEIETHKDAEVLTVAIQNEAPCIWLKLDTEKPIVKRMIVTIGTGRDCSDSREEDICGNYLGTYALFEGDVIYHVFDKIN